MKNPRFCANGAVYEYVIERSSMWHGGEEIITGIRRVGTVVDGVEYSLRAIDDEEEMHLQKLQRAYTRKD